MFSFLNVLKYEICKCNKVKLSKYTFKMESRKNYLRVTQKIVVYIKYGICLFAYVNLVDR